VEICIKLKFNFQVEFFKFEIRVEPFFNKRNIEFRAGPIRASVFKNFYRFESNLVYKRLTGKILPELTPTNRQFDRGALVTDNCLCPMALDGEVFTPIMRRKEPNFEDPLMLIIHSGRNQ